MNLDGFDGGDDGAADSVTAVGTEAPDAVGVGSDAGAVVVTGLVPVLRVTGGAPTQDFVGVETLGGDDRIGSGVSFAGAAPAESPAACATSARSRTTRSSMARRSLVTVSAMPDASHATLPSDVTLVKSITAIERGPRRSGDTPDAGRTGVGPGAGASATSTGATKR